MSCCSSQSWNGDKPDEYRERLQILRSHHLAQRCPVFAAQMRGSQSAKQKAPQEVLQDCLRVYEN